MTDAFKRLGHDVRHIGPTHGRDIWGITVPERYVHTPDGQYSPTIIDSFDLYDKDDFFIPELIIYIDSDPEILYSRLNKKHHRTYKEGSSFPYIRGAKRAVYGVDNHVRSYLRPHFDHYFYAHRGVSVDTWDDAIMTWLPCAYDPTLFTPSPIPYAEREYDVCMLGVMYPQRWALVNALKDAGLKVYAGTGLLFEDYRDAYWNARISLCVSANGDVAQRIFETAAMGCLVVSDPCADFERLGITPDMVLVGNDNHEIVNWCKLFATRAERAEQYIAQSLEWSRVHTWDARAQVIVDWARKQQAGEAFYATSE